MTDKPITDLKDNYVLTRNDNSTLCFICVICGKGQPLPHQHAKVTFPVCDHCIGMIRKSIGVDFDRR